ncbi:MAG TPA: alpha/beta hydrolase [Duganella sp.]|nr:alpha/beta hydrolase [Duganella sp.]
MAHPKFRLTRYLLAACWAASSVVAYAAPVGIPGSNGDQVSFETRFHHGVAVVNGVRLHYVEGGKDAQGDPILLIPGWPQSWYAWRFVMPKLVAAGHRVIALDLRGMGDSDHPMHGYDSKTIAADIHAFVESQGLARQGRLHVASHDVGAWMAYAHAAEWPRDIRTLTVMEAALPGITPPAPAGIPGEDANLRSWHFAFNRLPDLPEMLVQGHERAYLQWLFAQKSVKGYVFTPDAQDEYVRVFAQPGGARAAFSYYRAAFSDSGLRQNRLRAATRLAMPVLAVGGQYSVGEGMLNTMKLVATDVRGVTIPGAGHFVLEESPADVAEAILKFVSAAQPAP